MRTLLSITAFSLITTHSLADTVWLTNGDRISGDIIELSNSSLKIKTRYASTLSLDISAVRSFQTDTKQHWDINLKSRPALIDQSDREGHVSIDGKPVAIRDLELLPSRAKWKKSGLLESTLDVDNDKNRKEKLHLNGELNLESKHWRHSLATETKRDKERDKLTEDTLEFNYTLDYLINTHWLARADTSYREEGVDITSHYWYLAAGPGYRLWGEGKDKLDAVLAYNRFWVGNRILDLELSAWSLGLDYQQFWLAEKLETFTDARIAFPDIDPIDYIANTSSGLRYHLNHSIHLSLKYDYNETRYSLGTLKDSSYVLGAGVNF
jgi:Protein of unknown function, DUF481